MSTQEGDIFRGPMTEDAKQKFLSAGRNLAFISISIQIVLGLLVFFDILQLYPRGMGPGEITGFAERFRYAFQYQSLLALWLLIAVNATIFGRYKSFAFNPINPDTEKNVEPYKNILTNSVESVLISIISQLAFVSFAGPETILKFVPLINIVQFIGRIIYFHGYPMRRSFGFMMTMLPNSMMVIYSIIKFVLMFF